MKAKEIQNKFITSLYHDNKDIFTHVKTSRFDKDDLMTIYKNNLYTNLINSLQITFERASSYLKNKEFSDLAIDFIKKNPSRTGNLDDYGFEFIEFLRKNHSEFLSDLANIDWLAHRSYLAKDDGYFNVEEFSKLGEEELLNIKLQISTSCFLFKSKFSLFAKRNAKKERKNPCYYAVFRNELEIKTLKISKKEYLFLKSAQENKNLEKICKISTCNLEKSLQQCILERIIVGFIA